VINGIGSSGEEMKQQQLRDPGICGEQHDSALNNTNLYLSAHLFIQSKAIMYSQKFIFC